ncbi:B12 binding domain protein [Peptococcaceae bacterium CEB3]|nr:B12 binding domain protein [Peptococcaceae bacterium CEB3]
MSDMQVIKEAVISGNAAKVKENTEKAVAGGVDVGTILNEGLIAGMNVIGGAPVTQKFADEIGADAYAPDAATAVDLAEDLLA